MPGCNVLNGDDCRWRVEEDHGGVEVLTRSPTTGIHKARHYSAARVCVLEHERSHVIDIVAPGYKHMHKHIHIQEYVTHILSGLEYMCLTPCLLVRSY